MVVHVTCRYCRYSNQMIDLIAIEKVSDTVLRAYPGKIEKIIM